MPRRENSHQTACQDSKFLNSNAVSITNSGLVSLLSQWCSFVRANMCQQEFVFLVTSGVGAPVTFAVELQEELSVPTWYDRLERITLHHAW